MKDAKDLTDVELTTWAQSIMAKVIPPEIPSVDVTDYVSDMDAAWSVAKACGCLSDIIEFIPHVPHWGVRLSGGEQHYHRKPAAALLRACYAVTSVTP